MGDWSAFQLRPTVWAGAATPVPVRVAEEGELAALLVKDAVVEAAPLDCGENVTVKFTLWPADSVTGNDSPVIENSEPPTSTEETTTDAPLAVRVAV